MKYRRVIKEISYNHDPSIFHWIFVSCFSGSQAVVSFVLEKELSTSSFSLVAEEVKAQLVFSVLLITVISK